MDGSIVGALRILLRASMTHFGHKLSVVRGKPSGGFDFCQDLSRGLSDHLGMNDSFGLYWLKNCIVLKMPPATVARAFSACLIGFICFPSRRSYKVRSAAACRGETAAGFGTGDHTRIATLRQAACLIFQSVGLSFGPQKVS